MPRTKQYVSPLLKKSSPPQIPAANIKGGPGGSLLPPTDFYKEYSRARKFRNTAEAGHYAHILNHLEGIKLVDPRESWHYMETRNNGANTLFEDVIGSYVYSEADLKTSKAKFEASQASVEAVKLAKKEERRNCNRQKQQRAVKEEKRLETEAEARMLDEARARRRQADSQRVAGSNRGHVENDDAAFVGRRHRHDSFEQRLEQWRQDVEEYFISEYEENKVFPAPPSKPCGEVSCEAKERALQACECNIKTAFETIQDLELKTERLRWHPDKFTKASCGENAEEKAKEVFVVLDAMYKKQLAGQKAAKNE